MLQSKVPITKHCQTERSRSLEKENFHYVQNGKKNPLDLRGLIFKRTIYYFTTFNNFDNVVVPVVKV